MAIPSDLSTTTQSHLDQLVADRTREGHAIDFKREFPPVWDSTAKHEFLADATAFANAGGGDLIFGIDEDGQANAAAIIPLALANADQEVRRLQDFLLNLVEPRLPGVQVHVIPVSVGEISGHVVIVRVPESWVGPHRVRTNQHFFVRDGLRKRQLDIPEIRSLFLRSDNQGQRIRDFRAERLGNLLSGGAPCRLFDAPILVVHFVPTQSALGLVQIDPVVYSRTRCVPVLGTTNGQVRLNIDGALAVRNLTPQGETHGYSQLFRNGFFEATYVLTHRAENGRVLLAGTSYEEYVIALLTAFRAELAHHAISQECAVMLSILRADEVKLGVSDDRAYLEPHQTLFDRRVLILPDILAPADIAPELALKPVFDLVWQAAGFDGSANFNAAGQWAPRRH